MKISKEDFEYMKTQIRAVAGKDIWEKHYKPVGLTEKRYRWDMMWNSGLSRWVCDTLYPKNINDDHIDTALRKICQEDYANG